MTQTPARFKRLKKAEDTLLKKAISCMEKAISIPPSKEKGTQDADEIFAKFLESELRSIHDPRWKEWCSGKCNPSYIKRTWENCPVHKT